MEYKEMHLRQTQLMVLTNQTTILIYNLSSLFFISFIGYNFVVISFGVLLNLIVSHYDPNIVLNAIRATAVVTIIMMLMGILFPRFFLSIRNVLFLALIVVIIFEFIDIFILKTHHGFIDWVVALIFSGYIGFDWARANNIPYTIDNAVDSAGALYVDIVNLFVRILSIFGRKK